MCIELNLISLVELLLISGSNNDVVTFIYSEGQRSTSDISLIVDMDKTDKKTMWWYSVLYLFSNTVIDVVSEPQATGCTPLSIRPHFRTLSWPILALLLALALALCIYSVIHHSGTTKALCFPCVHMTGRCKVTMLALLAKCKMLPAAFLWLDVPIGFCWPLWHQI